MMKLRTSLMPKLDVTIFFLTDELNGKYLLCLMIRTCRLSEWRSVNKMMNKPKYKKLLLYLYSLYDYWNFEMLPDKAFSF